MPEAITQGNIKTAVDAWILDPITAEQTYGDISNWNTSSVTDMKDLFKGNGTFDGDISNWDVSNVTDMTSMFHNATNFNGDILNWNVSNVTNMNAMFQTASNFNGDISNWDVSSVTNMSYMFHTATAFNGDIARWDVSNVTNMDWMFNSASNFNGDIARWDVSNVTDMNNMFVYAYNFNGDISGWDVSKVTNMGWMFAQTRNFNRDIYNWDVSSVTNMSGMFYAASSFNKDISNWDVSNVTDMGYMFNHTGVSYTTNCIKIKNSWSAKVESAIWELVGLVCYTLFPPADTLLDQITIEANAELKKAVNLWISNEASAINTYGKISNWDTSNVTDMKAMFYGATNFNGDISNWDVSNVTDMHYMFRNATSFTRDISNWDVSSVTHTSGMFRNATNFNGDISGWDVSSVTGSNSMIGMFQDATNFNQDISGWNVSNVTYIQSMFRNATSFNRDIARWDVSNVTTMNDMFLYATGLSGVNKEEIYRFWLNKVTTTTNSLSSASFGLSPTPSAVTPITQENIKTAVDLWISNETSAITTYGKISNWDTSGVTNMKELFKNKGTFSGDISNWNVSKVTDMQQVFNGATNFNGDISNWDVSKVTDMYYMFGDATNFNWDISNWDVSNVTRMTYMFYNDTNFNGDISNWDVSSVTDMSFMFYNDTNFNRDISNWNVSSVTTMSFMFQRATSFNKDIAKWDVSNVTGMNNMFNNATSFNGDISKWDVSSVTTMYNMFYNATGLSDKNKEEIYRFWLNKVTTTTNSLSTASLGVTVPAVTKITQSNIQTAVDLWISNEASAITTYGKISNWDVSKVTNMSWMFQGATNFNGDISGWDVSSVTDMSYMFHTATNFNGDISGWDVSNVTNMQSMFNSATNFNRDIARWDVSNVTNMNYMFNQATSFNGDISNWDTSNVTHMGQMFYYATSFNQDIASWDVSNVTNMNSMFSGATALSDKNKEEIYRFWLNKVTTTTNSLSTASFGLSPTPLAFTPITQANIKTAVNLWISNRTSALTTYGNISNWDVSQVTNMKELFKNKGTFSGDISNWNVSKVTDMQQVFNGATNFNGDISNWDVSKVTDMYYMFGDATNFNGDISNWDVSNVTRMTSMFHNATNFNGDILNWDVSSVTNMQAMFNTASNFDRDISNWDVSSVTNMSWMFTNATYFNRDIARWNVSNVTNMSYMFYYATGLSVQNKEEIYRFWAEKTPNNIGDASLGVTVPAVTKITQENIKTAVDLWISNETSALTTYGNISNWDVSQVTNMNGMFYAASSFNEDISDWNVSKVTNMTSMFSGATNFNGDISNWNTSNVTTMYNMFYNATSFKGDISNWDTGKVTNMSFMFENATSFNGDINTKTVTGSTGTTYTAWDVSKVTNMNWMFYNATNFKGDISNWDTGSVTNMSSMFSGATNFNGDISNWNTSNVTTMYNMFYNATSFNKDISEWVVSSVTNMDGMFESATSFNRDISNWTVSQVTNMTDMFTGATGFTPINKKAIYAKWQSPAEWEEFTIPPGIPIIEEKEDFYNVKPTSITITAENNANVAIKHTSQDVIHTHYLEMVDDGEGDAGNTSIRYDFEKNNITEGENTYIIHATDEAGNDSDSVQFSFIYDTQSPPAPSYCTCSGNVTVSEGNVYYNENSFQNNNYITVVGESGGNLIVNHTDSFRTTDYDSETVTLSEINGVTTHYTYKIPTPSNLDGTDLNTYKFRIRDRAGNESGNVGASSDCYHKFFYDTVAPSPPTSINEYNQYLNDIPTIFEFIGEKECTLEMFINDNKFDSGNITIMETVIIVDSQHVDQGNVIYGAQITDVFKQYYPGGSEIPNGILEYKVRLTDKANNTGGNSVPYSFTYDTVAPLAPTSINGYNQYLNDIPTIFEFIGEKECTLEMFIGNNKFDSGNIKITKTVIIVDSQHVDQGNVTYGAQITDVFKQYYPGGSEIPNGILEYKVRLTDKANNTGGNSEPYSFTYDTVAPLAPMSISQHKQYLNEIPTVFEFIGEKECTLEMFINDNKFDSGNITVSKTNITLDTDHIDQGNVIYRAQVKDTYKHYYPNVETQIQNGIIKYTATLTDEATNTSEKNAPMTLNYDTVPPNIPLINDIDTISNSFYREETLIEQITITAENHANVSIKHTSKVDTHNHYFEIGDDGVGDAGNTSMIYSLDKNHITLGENTYTIRATDRAGNEGTGVQFSFVYDTAVTPAPSYCTCSGNVTVSEGNVYYNENSFQNNNYITVVGESGGNLIVNHTDSFRTTDYDSETVTLSEINGVTTHYTYKIPTPSNLDGTDLNTYKFRIRDRAGNESGNVGASSDFYHKFFYDTVAPSPPTSINEYNQYLNDIPTIFEFIGEKECTVTLFLGNQSYPKERITVTQIDNLVGDEGNTAYNIEIIDKTISPNSINTILDGELTFTIKLTDLANNISANSNPYTFIYDTTPPNNIIFNTSPDHGSAVVSKFFSQSQYNVKFTSEKVDINNVLIYQFHHNNDGSKLDQFNGGYKPLNHTELKTQGGNIVQILGTENETDNSIQYLFIPPNILSGGLEIPDGNISYKFNIRDSANNFSGNSAEYTFIVVNDSIPPEIPKIKTAEISTTFGNTISYNHPDWAGHIEFEGESVAKIEVFHKLNSESWAIEDTPSLLHGTSFDLEGILTSKYTYTMEPNLSDGIHKYMFRLTDDANNVGGNSAVYQFNMHNTKPEMLNIFGHDHNLITTPIQSGNTGIPDILTFDVQKGLKNANIINVEIYESGNMVGNLTPTENGSIFTHGNVDAEGNIVGSKILQTSISKIDIYVTVDSGKFKFWEDSDHVTEILRRDFISGIVYRFGISHKSNRGNKLAFSEHELTLNPINVTDEGDVLDSYVEYIFDEYVLPIYSYADEIATNFDPADPDNPDAEFQALETAFNMGYEHTITPNLPILQYSFVIPRYLSGGANVVDKSYKYQFKVRDELYNESGNSLAYQFTIDNTPPIKPMVMFYETYLG